MKRVMFIVLMLSLIGFGSFNYASYENTGRLPVRDWLSTINTHESLTSTQEMIEDVKEKVTGAVADNLGEPSKKTVQFYKWTDEKGVVHFDSQPVKGAKVIHVDPNINVMPTHKPLDIKPVDQPPVDEAKQAIENVEKMRAAREAAAGI